MKWVYSALIVLGVVIMISLPTLLSIFVHPVLGFVIIVAALFIGAVIGIKNTYFE